MWSAVDAVLFGTALIYLLMVRFSLIHTRTTKIVSNICERKNEKKKKRNSKSKKNMKCTEKQRLIGMMNNEKSYLMLTLQQGHRFGPGQLLRGVLRQWVYLTRIHSVPWVFCNVFKIDAVHGALHQIPQRVIPHVVSLP